MASESKSEKSLKIIIHSLDGTGHINACIGLGQALAKRGHQVQFMINVAFKGQLSCFGFEELYLVDKPKELSSEQQKTPETSDDSKVNPIKVVAEQLLASGMLSGVSPLEKLKMMVNSDFMEDMFKRTVVFNPQMEDLFALHKPDLIVMDHFLVPPAIPRANIPYILIMSGNPLMLYNSAKLPPGCSGFATTSDPSTWVEFQEILKQTFQDNVSQFQARLNAACNYEPPEAPKELKVSGFSLSPYLNVYGYPLELDYQDIVPLPGNIVQVDAFCRETPEPFQLPEELNIKPGDKLIYVSMGSMGSIDVKLNSRVASALAKTSYKCIISKGPLADEYELPPNCWGKAFLPQTQILPLVDLVITHGGNNTVTETFSFGKPMIVMPLFADQFDNAQRLKEKGIGERIEPYAFEETELIEAVDRLINNEELKTKLQLAAKRIAESNSKDAACKRIEEVVEQFQTASQ